MLCMYAHAHNMCGSFSFNRSFNRKFNFCVYSKHSVTNTIKITKKEEKTSNYYIKSYICNKISSMRLMVKEGHLKFNIVMICFMYFQFFVE